MHAGGRGRGDFDDRPPPSFAPDREAQLGSAARPGKVVKLKSTAETEALARTHDRTFKAYPNALQVPHPSKMHILSCTPSYAAASPRFWDEAH